jgi:hypothetical protein
MSKGKRNGWFRVAIGAGSFLLISWASFSQQNGQPAASGQKVDWAAFLPAGEGKFQTAAYCTQCHTLQPIVGGDRRSDEAGWLETVQTMVYGYTNSRNEAPIEDGDIAVIGKYLARYFGPSTPKLELPIHINTAPKQILVLLGTLSEEEVQKIPDARTKGKVTDFTALEALVGNGKLYKYKSFITFDDGSDKSK